MDLLIGGIATDSAKFAVLGVSTNTPTASISAQNANGYAMYLDPANGTLQTLRNQTLTLGGSSTGNINLAENTSITGSLAVTGAIAANGGITFDNPTDTLGAFTLGGTIAGGGNNITGLGTINGLQITANTGAITTGTWNGSVIAGQYGGTGVANTGKTITVSGNTVIGTGTDTVTLNTTGATSVTLPTSGTLCTTATCSLGTNWWTTSVDTKALVQTNTTMDLLIGGIATDSAKFAVLGVSTNTPTASISAQNANGYAMYLDPANGTLQTLRNQTLTLGGSSTGNINLAENTSITGSLAVTGAIAANGGITFDNPTDTLGAFTLGGTIAGGGNNITGLGTINGLQITANTGAITTGTWNGSVIAGQYGGTGVANTGKTITVSGNTVIGTGTDTVTLNTTGATSVTLPTSGTLCTTATCALGTNWWTTSVDTKALVQTNTTMDLLIGGIATDSAKFAVLGVSTNTPTASISAQNANGYAMYLDPANGTLQTLRNQTLTLGGSSTGNINLAENTSITGSLAVTGAIAANGGITFDNPTDTLGAFTMAGTIAGGGNNITGLGTINGLQITANTGAITTGTWNGSVIAGQYGGTGVANTGKTITVSGNTVIGTGTDTVTLNTTGATSVTLPTSGTLCTTATCSLGTNWWTTSVDTKALVQTNTTMDLLIGGTSTSSADFAVLNVNGSGPATASVSGNLIVMPNNGAGGNVGIGIINPTSPLDIYKEFGSAGTALNINATSSAASSQIIGESISVTGGAIGGDGQTLGLYINANSRADGTDYSGSGGEITSLNAAATHLGSGDLTSLTGGFMSATNSTGALVGYANGVVGNVVNNDVGSITSAYGGNFGVSNSLSGTIGAASGVSGSVINGSGTITSATGGSFGIVNDGTITDGYGLFIGPAQNSGTFTNNYGLYIGDQSFVGSTKSYNLYSEGANAKNYFQGKVAIGTEIPISQFFVTRPLSDGVLGKALAIFDQIENQDIFTASASGTTRFSITNAGGIKLGTDEGSATDCLLSGGSGLAAYWDTCPGGSGAFSIDATNGTTIQNITTTDLLIGGVATTSAKFAVLNIDGNTSPVASLSATTASGGNGNGLVLAAGGIQSLNNQTLTIGGLTTGNINLAENVGINTANPKTQLHIQGTDGSILAGFDGTGDTWGVAIQTNTGGGWARGYTFLDSTGSEMLEFAAYASGDTLNYGYISAGSSDWTRPWLAYTNDARIGINSTTFPSALYVTRNLTDYTATGKALSIFNQTENQDIFTASASGATKFTITNAGNILPGADNTMSLGASPSARFKDLYLGPSSLHVLCTTGDGCGQNLDYALGVDSTTNEFYIGANGTSGALNKRLGISEGGTVNIPALDVSNSIDVTGATVTGLELNDLDDVIAVLPTQGQYLAWDLNSSETDRTWDGNAQDGMFDAIRTAGWDNEITGSMSTTFSGSATNMIDGTDETIAHTDSGVPQWIKLDLGQTSEGYDRTISANYFAIRTRDFSNQRPRNFYIQGSNNNADWTTVYTWGSTAIAQNSWGSAAITDDTPYRYWRIYLYGTDSSGSSYLVIDEFELWGTVSVPSDPQYRLSDFDTDAVTAVRSAGLGAFTLNTSNGAIYQSITTTDLILGGTATTSAKFAILGLATTTPTASLSAVGGTGNGLVFGSDGSIQSLRNNTLTLGGDTTGGINFADNVGINTPNPTTKLEVTGTSDGFVRFNNTTTEMETRFDGDQITIRNNKSSGGWATDLLEFEDTIGTSYVSLGGYGSGQAFNYFFISDTTSEWSTPAVQYVPGGKFGIGTTNTGGSANWAQTALHVSRDLSYWDALGKALVIFDQPEDQDIFTASASGTTKFTINNDGDLLPGADDTQDLGSASLRWQDLYLGPASIHIGASGDEGILSWDTGTNTFGFDTDGDATPEFSIQDNGDLVFKNNSSYFATITPSVLSQNRTITIPNQDGTLCLNGTVDCGFALGTNYWQINNKLVSTINSTYDFAIGGDSTTSAKFAILNNSGSRGTQAATLSGSISLDSNTASIQTTDKKTLTLGGSTTGNIVVASSLDLTGATITGLDLDDLDSVNTSGVTDGKVLQWNSGSSSWIAGSTLAEDTYLSSDPGGYYIGGTQTVYLRPNADGARAGTVTWTNSGTQDAYQQVDEATLDSADYIQFTNATGASYQILELENYPGLVTDTIISLTVTARVSNPAVANTNSVYLRRISTGETWLASSFAQAETATKTSSTLTTNPWTGLAWTIDDLNDLGLYTTRTATGLGQMRWYWSYITVNYAGGITIADVLQLLGPGLSWDRSADGKAIIENNTTRDLLLGGVSTPSAKFGFLNMAGGTPTASISANSGANALYLAGNGSIATTNKQSLNLGGTTTGLINVLNSSGGTFATFDTLNSRFGLGTSTPISQFHVTRPLSFGATGKALAIFDQIENQDIFTASSSGTTRFVIQNDGDVGIGTATPAYNLEIESLTDAAIFLQADTDNSGGADNPFIKLSQDNGARESIIGMVGTAGVDPENVAYTDTLNDALLIGTLDASALQLGNFGGVSLTIDTNRRVGIGDTTPDATLEISYNNGEQFRITHTDNVDDARFSVDDNGDLTLDLSGGQFLLADADTIGIGGIGAGLAYNAISDSGGAANKISSASDDDLYIEGDLEIDGTMYIDGAISAGGSTGAGQCLMGGVSSVTWGTCGGTTYFTASSDLKAIIQGNTTMDLLLGGTASSSAKFAFLNMNPGSGNPTFNLYDAGNTNYLSMYNNGTDSFIFSNTGELVLGTGTGGVIIEDSIINDTANNAGAVRISDKFLVQNTESAGNALAIFNNTGAGDILVASASSTTVFRIASNGNVELTLATAGTTNDAVCWDNSGSTLLYDCDSTPADYAEVYPSTSDVVYGDIVMTTDQMVTTNVGTKVSRITKAVEASNSRILGVTSDNWHDFTSAGKDEINGSDNPIPVALNGRVMTNVTSENGSIQIGDSITVSSKPGAGAKSIKAERVVGTALESYSSSDTNAVGQILVFINPGYHDPDVYLTDSGNLNLSYNPVQELGIVLKNGELVTRIGAFAELVIGKIKAGFIEANKVSTDSLTVNTGDVTINGKSLDQYILDLTSSQSASMDACQITNLDSTIDQRINDVLLTYGSFNVETSTSSSQILAELVNQSQAQGSPSTVLTTDILLAGFEIITPKLTAAEINVGILRANQIEGLDIIAGSLAIADIQDLKTRLALLQEQANQATQSATPIATPSASPAEDLLAKLLTESASNSAHDSGNGIHLFNRRSRSSYSIRKP